jgi:hypothetical protein
MLCEYCEGTINSKPKYFILQIFSDFSAALAARILQGEPCRQDIQSIIEHYKEMKNDAEKLLR